MSWLVAYMSIIPVVSFYLGWLMARHSRNHPR